MKHADVILVSVGNTRTRCAPLVAGALQPSTVVENAPPAEIAATIRAIDPSAPILIASVNDPLADPVAESLRASGRRVLRAGVDGRGLSIPLRHVLTPPVKVGVDRLLAALGAYSRSSQACVVVDAGTAITVDLVDASGVFQGGCIAPGLSLMLRSLHEHTAALPLIEIKGGVLPESARANQEHLGTETTPAMVKGCIAAARGMAHLLIDRYAELIGNYPRVVATGGDAPLLFADDDLVENIVPDLVLIGLAATYEAGAPAEAQ
ncbi:MAG: type III pantothenate kinase [Phycisphaerales bacterium]